MLPVHQAETLILNLAQPLDPRVDVETIDLLSAAGRILATSVSSAIDFPHWDNSAMDGYAVRYRDVKACSAEHPVTLEIVEEIPAGYQPQKPIQPGQAARILTGSMMPRGADTIVIQEETERSGNRVTIRSAPRPDAFVRRQGEYYQAGTPLLAAGVCLAAPEIAVLAAAQCIQVPVYRRPRVAILSTGSELVPPDRPLQPGQIVDSNQYALAALLARTGAEPVCLGIIPDDPATLRQAIADAVSKADIVLSSGGVSVGDYDYVDEILAELGATIHVRSVAIKPGKPLTVATFAGSGQAAEVKKRRGRPKKQAPLPIPLQSGSQLQSSVLYFGLPGNPVSALVSFWRFVQPALRKVSGLPEGWQPMFIWGRSLQDLRSDGKRETYLWGRLRLIQGTYRFQLASGSHSSGNLINLAQTNALAVVPIGQTLISAGDAVQIMPVSDFFGF